MHVFLSPSPASSCQVSRKEQGCHLSCRPFLPMMVALLNINLARLLQNHLQVMLHQQTLGAFGLSSSASLLSAAMTSSSAIHSSDLQTFYGHCLPHALVGAHRTAGNLAALQQRQKRSFCAPTLCLILLELPQPATNTLREHSQQRVPAWHITSATSAAQQ